MARIVRYKRDSWIVPASPRALGFAERRAHQGEVRAGAYKKKDPEPRRVQGKRGDGEFKKQRTV